jgi:hypothetical protein
MAMLISVALFLTLFQPAALVTGSPPLARGTESPASGQPTMNKRSNPPMPVAGQRRLPPVRVKLLRDGDDNLTVIDA